MRTSGIKLLHTCNGRQGVRRQSDHLSIETNACSFMPCHRILEIAVGTIEASLLEMTLPRGMPSSLLPISQWHHVTWVDWGKAACRWRRVLGNPVSRRRGCRRWICLPSIYTSCSYIRIVSGGSATAVAVDQFGGCLYDAVRVRGEEIASPSKSTCTWTFVTEHIASLPFIPLHSPLGM